MSFRKQKIYWIGLIIVSLIAALAIAGCGSTGAGDSLDATAPTVTSTSPIDGATGVPINAKITASFSEAMDPATIIAANFTLADGGSAVTGTVTYDDANMRAIFEPASDLTADTVYTATVTTGMMDSAGNQLAADTTWTFTTGATADSTVPTVTSTSPIDGATGVAITTNITAVFSEAMDPSTIVAANFTLAPTGGTSISGTVTYDIGNTAAVFSPGVNLDAITEYTATVTTGVTDYAGNAMAAEKVWTFTTAAAGSGPAPVSLGTAGNFAILAKTEISTVPASAITGDIGLSPAATSYITGFTLTNWTGYATSDQVTGFIYASDMAPPTPTNMTTAISDMEAAYSDAAGRTANPIVLATDIGGKTLSPGLHVATGNVGISSNVTLDGAANDVWIFQIPGNLSTSSAINVTLSGGAQAKNIFWQVGGSVTVGTEAHFEGILLCSTAITFGNLTTMNGRALAQSAVALNQTTVVEP